MILFGKRHRHRLLKMLGILEVMFQATSRDFLVFPHFRSFWLRKQAMLQALYLGAIDAGYHHCKIYWHVLVLAAALLSVTLCILCISPVPNGWSLVRR